MEVTIHQHHAFTVICKNLCDIRGHRRLTVFFTGRDDEDHHRFSRRCVTVNASTQQAERFRKWVPVVRPKDTYCDLVFALPGNCAINRKTNCRANLLLALKTTRPCALPKYQSNADNKAGERAE